LRLQGEYAVTTESFEPTELNGDENMSAAGTVGVAQETMEKFLEAASVDAVYGEPLTYGDTVVVPAAEVVSLMAFGLGYGGMTGPDPKGAGGGGGRILSRPVAAIVISPAGVRVEPIVDVTKVGLAALTAFGFMAATLWRMSRPGRRA
jgi:uncharacterized spore protein YtfJ